jgi:hypothetical protein
MAAEKMEIMNEPIRSIPSKIKLFSGPGTRKWPRFNIADVPLIKEVQSNTGSRLRIINISRGGAFLWTKRRLIRGVLIRLKVITSEEVIPLSASVLRSLVFASKWMPRYQSAVVFDRPLQIFNHDSKPAMDIQPVTSIHPSPLDAFAVESNISFCDSSQGEDLPMIADFGALNLWTERYAGMHEELKLNNW